MKRTGIGQPRLPERYQLPQIWPPTVLPNCRGWFDMLEPGSFGTVSGTVNSITNKVSGTALATAATAFPLFEKDGLNGRPCMRGDGARGIMGTEAALIAPFAGTDPPFTLFYVYENFAPTTLVTAVALGQAGAGSTGSYLFGTHSFGDGRYLAFRQDDADASNNEISGEFATADPQVVTWVCRGPEVIRRTNGRIYTVGLGSFDVGAITPDRFGLFVRPDADPDLFLVGRIGCVIVYSGALSDYAAGGIENALMRRWGLS